MLRVGFDLTGLELDAAGTARAATGLLERLSLRPDVEVFPLAQPRRPRSPGRVARGLARELAWYPRALPRRAAELRLDVLHCPFPLAPPRAGAVPVVLTVHDALALERPEWFTRANAAHARLVLARAARAASVVLTSSAYSRARIEERLGVAPERIVVAPPGVDSRFSPGPRPQPMLDRLGVGEAPYVLAVGTVQPRKNLAAAVGAVERLAARGMPHHLVIVGASGWREGGAGGTGASRVHVAGRLDDDDLVGVYRGAECLLFLSLAEGFGLPPLEAMACGTPVISSDRTSLREVVGDAGMLVDPHDEAAIDAALEEVLGSPSRRAELIRRGRERVRSFGWRESAERVVAAYREAAGQLSRARRARSAR